MLRPAGNVHGSALSFFVSSSVPDGESPSPLGLSVVRRACQFARSSFLRFASVFCRCVHKVVALAQSTFRRLSPGYLSLSANLRLEPAHSLSYVKSATCCEMLRSSPSSVHQFFVRTFSHVRQGCTLRHTVGMLSESHFPPSAMPVWVDAILQRIPRTDNASLIRKCENRQRHGQRLFLYPVSLSLSPSSDN